MLLAFVLDDHKGLATLTCVLLTNGFAYLDVDEAHDAVLLGQDRRPVRIPAEQLLASLHLFARPDQDVRRVGDLVLFDFASLGVENGQLAVALQRGEDAFAFVRFDLDFVAVAQLDDAAMAGGDASLDEPGRGDAACVEGAHRQLRARLADRLGSDDAHRHALLDEPARGHVHAVALGADAKVGFTGQRRTDKDGLDAQVLDLARSLGGDHAPRLDDELVGDGVGDGLQGDAAENLLAQGNVDLLALVDGSFGDPVGAATVLLADDDGLGDVAEFACEIARVSGLEGGVGQALAGAVRGAEVFEDGEPLAEVGADGGLDDFAAGLGHQASHARQLLHLRDVAAGARVGHHVDGVHVAAALVGVDREILARLGVAAVVLEGVDQLLGDLLAAVGPDVQQLVVALALGDDAPLVVLLHPLHELLRLRDELLFLLGNAQVGDAEGDACDGRLPEPDVLQLVKKIDRGGPAATLVAVGDDARGASLAQRTVVKGHARLENVGEEDAPDRRHHAAMAGQRLRLTVLADDLLVEAVEPDHDPLVQADAARVVGQDGLLAVLEAAQLLLGPLVVGVLHREEVDAHDHVL